MRYALKRLFVAFMVAVTVSVATFVLLHAATDPAEAMAGEDADPAVVEEIRQQYGFDRPLPVQYLDWLGGVLQGDFGDSYFWRKPVGQLIAQHIPVTIKLALGAILVTVFTAIPLGIIAALKPNSIIDRATLVIGMAAQAIPNFWLGVMCIILFAVIWPIFPVSGEDTWRHFVMPWVVLGTSSIPAVLRLTRAGMVEVMSSDYIRTARANGFLTRQILVRHALRNALLPVVSVLAVQLGHKLGGSVITESVFALNGLGRLALDSILGADIPTVQMLVFFFAMTFVVLTFLADLLNAWLDPRIRLS